MKDWKDKLSGFFRAKGVPPEDTATQEQAQSAWDHFVTHQVLPTFQEIKSIFERNDGTTVDIQQAPAGERWVRLTWMVAPSPSMLAVLPPSARTAQPPQTVLTYTIIGDEQSAQTTAWCETRIPHKAGDQTSSSRVFREALGDYRRKSVTKDTIRSNFLTNYQRHVLGFRRKPTPQVNPPPALQTRPEETSLSPKITPNSAVFMLRPEDSVPAIWKVGDVLMNQYEVMGILGEGGMGTVYKIHYAAWNRDLAVKSPRPEIFVKTGGKEHFIREAQTWVHLREHPHLVRCYFVETMGGIPRIFAEYIEGGSLADWIHRRKLYEGGPQRALERILDISIQFAWGLHAAHEQGLVHQDIKPTNVMMTLEGVAKVTDFGLAKARTMAGEQEVPDEKGQQSLLVSSRGMTPAYCSPEQSTGQLLSRKTDIWSWGVSVLEMFVGRVTWRLGVEARDALSRYERQDPTLPLMPAEVVKVLSRCFESQAEARPATISEVATELQAIYARLLGCPYAREAPEQAELDANTLIHRGTSLRQLGQPQEALLAFEQAIRLNPTSTYAYNNKGNTLQEMGQLREALLAFEQAIHLDPDYFAAYHGKGMVLAVLKRPQEALLAFEQAIRLNPTTYTYNNKGNVLKDLGRPQEALLAFEQAIRLDPTFASTYNNKGAALAALGQLEEALLTYEQAIRLDPASAPICYGKGLTLYHLGRAEEALLTYEQAIRLDPTFALAHYSKGFVLQQFRRFEEALLAFEQAIRLDPTFADSYYHKAAILADLGRLEESRQAYYQAQALRFLG